MQDQPNLMRGRHLYKGIQTMREEEHVIIHMNLKKQRGRKKIGCDGLWFEVEGKGGGGGCWGGGLGGWGKGQEQMSLQKGRPPKANSRLVNENTQGRH